MAVTSTSYPNQTGLVTVYEYGFVLQNNNELFATIDGVVQAQTEYTVGVPSENEVTFDTAPVGDLVLYRVTADEPIRAIFAPGSAIRAKDLNNNFEQLLFLAQENRNAIENIDVVVDGKVGSVVGEAPIVSTLTDSEANQYTVSITNATTEEDGAMSSEDKQKLDSLTLTETNNTTLVEEIDGTRTVFTLAHQASSAFDLTVSINGVLQQANVHYTYNAASNQITFASPPPVTSEYWITISGFRFSDGGGAFQTTATLPTVRQYPGLKKAVAPYDDSTNDIKFQSDVNDLIEEVTIIGAKNVARTADLFDFSQNTVVQGYWSHEENNGGVPGLGKFFATDEDGNITIQFLDVRAFKFNDNGLPGSPNDNNILASARIGDYLIVQSTNDNHFGAYVITGLNIYNTDDIICRELLVKVFGGNRAFGDVEFDDNCSVRILRPSSVIVQEDEPDVAQRGMLWYRESDDVLSISNYATGAFGQLGPQWTEINGGDSVDISGLEQRVSDGEAAQIEILGRLTQGEQKQALLTTNLGVIQGDYMKRTGSNSVDENWTIRSKDGAKTHMRVVDGTTTIYKLNPPTANDQAVNLGYANDNYLDKTGDTFTGGALRFKRTDDSSYWSYITFDTPEAWKTAENTHGVIINIGQTNSYKQQLKIQGRSGSELFKIFDDNKAVATLSGDLNVTGILKVGGETFNDADYLKKKGGTQNKMQGDLYLGGYGIKGVAEPELSTDAATKAYVDTKGRGSFQTKYDGNRFCIGQNAVSSTLIENGQVAFYGDASFGTTAPQNVRYIGFNIDEFNWDSFIGSGIIRVRNGANDAGYYQVYRRTENAGRNMIIHVSPVWTDVNQVLQGESGTPCYFQGVFFE